MSDNEIESLEDQLLAKYEEELNKAEEVVKSIKQKIDAIRAGRGMEPVGSVESGVGRLASFSNSKRSYLGMKLRDAIKQCLKANHSLMKAKDIIQELEAGEFYTEV